MTFLIGDVLEQLLEFKFRGISVPCSDFGTLVEQDQMDHLWPDRDGGHIEGTGRKPLVHHFTLHFRNNLSPGLAESWNVNNQALYPTVFRQFFVAVSDRSSGPLQHPELGIVTAKIRTADFRWSSQRRDGVDCTCQFKESDDSTSDFQDILARKSPVSEAHVASQDLDSQIIQYANPTITADSENGSFLDSIIAITSAFDQATLLQAQYAGKIDHVVYRVQNLQDRVTHALDVKAWPLITSGERLKGALFDMKTTLLTTEKEILHYVAARDTTLAALTGPTGTSITDLLKLNPGLASKPHVPLGTIIRRYAVR